MRSDDDSDLSERSTALNADTAGQSTDTARTGELIHEEKTRSIIASFYTVYDELGYGSLENVYCSALAFDSRSNPPSYSILPISDNC
jgi:hypothetical protein